eukprot:scaffold10568_cov64-Cyclotella_meneghiniana.AAC.7
MSRSNSSSIVTIDLTTHPPQTPLGILLAPSALPSESNSNGVHSNNQTRQIKNVTLVAGWEHIPPTNKSSLGSQLGPIQRTGLVRLGDRLVRINERDVTDWSFREVMDTLRQFVTGDDESGGGGKKKLKSLGFAPRNSHEWGRNTEIDESVFGLSGRQVHEKRAYSFASYVSRWRVMVDNDENFDDTTTYNGGIIEEENDLEEHLNKEPMQDSGYGQVVNNTPTNSPRSPAKKPKPYIQYEVQCHLLFHTKSFARKQSHAGNHYSWSVWKRYTQFKLLDAELRSLHGWQIDALDEGKGVTFPRERYLETLWYDVYGAVNKLFFTRNAAEIEEEKDRDIKVDTSESMEVPEYCPYPVQFIAKRQKELTTYWTQLMRIEEIFEFDIHNHKFAKAMASFLEVDRILMKRSSAQSVSGTSRLSRPAVIHEEMVDGLGELILPSSAVPLAREDDDVSLLSDGTGLRDSHDYGISPLRNTMHQQLQQQRLGGVSAGVSTTSSVVSGSSTNSKRRVGPRQGAKPAFQREFGV